MLERLNVRAAAGLPARTREPESCDDVDALAEDELFAEDVDLYVEAGEVGA
ncbi:hypothetical protein [Methanoculleus sp. 10]|uniref:hypothetical protein n=1 Tax=Methanoculleus sp. 10 TaxID=430615 RepID=UPI001B6AC523|nr:hypothetical protein [Methanoculleus sp. 10]MBP7298824.1 hypothetical protein [Methanoculleus sp.]